MVYKRVYLHICESLGKIIWTIIHHNSIKSKLETNSLKSLNYPFLPKMAGQNLSPLSHFHFFFLPSSSLDSLSNHRIDPLWISKLSSSNLKMFQAIKASHLGIKFFKSQESSCSSP